MRITYKEPYWVKFNWDLTSFHDNQYVTEFNKSVNERLNDFLHQESFAISCTFKVESDYKKDDISMIFGKPGKQMGLSYNSETNNVAFEYWLTVNGEDQFRYFHLKNVLNEDVQNGVTITLIRNKNELIGYKNFEEVNRCTLDGEFVEDYKVPGLFIGCASPESVEPNHRYHGEVEIDYFIITNDITNIGLIKEIHDSEVETLLKKDYYPNILCLYNFKTINNIGIVYDESKYSNFLEKVPSEFVL